MVSDEQLRRALEEDDDGISSDELVALRELLYALVRAAVDAESESRSAR